MEAILKEIERAVEAGLYYLAVATPLAPPDVCAALEREDGLTKPPRYKALYDTWLAPEYPMITAEDIYCLRCGVVHQGTVIGKTGTQYSRIVFYLPGRFAGGIHGVITEPSPEAMIPGPPVL